MRNRLDTSQHMSLCRHYVRELRRSVLISTPDLQKSGSKRSSGHDAEDATGNHHGMSGMNDKTEDQRLSAFLRMEQVQPSQAVQVPSMPINSNNGPGATNRTGVN